LTETVEIHLPSLINTRQPSLFKENKDKKILAYLELLYYIYIICEGHRLA
jgi:hypothetical protein